MTPPPAAPRQTRGPGGIIPPGGGLGGGAPLLSPSGALVLGVDPGSRVTGWAVVEERGGVARLVEAGTIRLDAEAAQWVRLGRLWRGVTDLLERFEPGEAAMEEIFTAKNAGSALKLGQARGAILAACGVRGVAVAGYEPSVVKKAVVGTGRADKEQVAFMVLRLLGEGGGAKHAVDATDAMAVAICHLNHRRFQRLATAGSRGGRA